MSGLRGGAALEIILTSNDSWKPLPNTDVAAAVPGTKRVKRRRFDPKQENQLHAAVRQYSVIASPDIHVTPAASGG